MWPQHVSRRSYSHLLSDMRLLLVVVTFGGVNACNFHELFELPCKMYSIVDSLRYCYKPTHIARTLYMSDSYGSCVPEFFS
jgi:hypothetical protein